MKVYVLVHEGEVERVYNIRTMTLQDKLTVDCLGDYRPLMRFVDAYSVGDKNDTVLYHGPGRIEPARIVLNGDCKRCAGTGIYTDDEMQCRACKGTGNYDRVAALEEQVEMLRNALSGMVNAYGHTGSVALDAARAALKEKSCENS